MTAEEIRKELFNTAFRFGRANMGIPLGNIPPGEFMVLQMLHHGSDEAGGISATQLAGKARMSPPALSRALNTLEEKGYVSRFTNPDNRRKTLVCLTDEGEKVRNQAWETAVEYFNRVTSAMGQEKMEQFLALWKELVEIMEKEMIRQKGEI